MAFRAVLRLFPVSFRAAAVPVTLAAALFGIHLSAVPELLALVVALVAILGGGGPMVTVPGRRGGSGESRFPGGRRPIRYLSRSWYIFRVCSVWARMTAVARCSSRSAIAAISARCSIQDWWPRCRATGV